LLLLPSAALAGASGLVVQQIGDVSGSLAAAVGAEVTVVPLSPTLDARTTPIVVGPGKVFVRRNGAQVAGLRPAERSAIRQAYEAGQVILLLDASTHDIEALHLLLADGVAHESSTDPVVLAYALRKENNIPTARLVTYPVKHDLAENDLPDDEADASELALSAALEIVVDELTRAPAAPAVDDPAASADWGSSPVQSTIITSTSNGTYNTPVEIFALHSCQQSKDYYLINTGGTWTATNAAYQSASKHAGQIRVDPNNGKLIVSWQNNTDSCEGGVAIDEPFGDYRICRYMNYPLTYEVDIVPPAGPRVVQVNAAPAGDQGQSTSYTSGFAFSIGGGVDVSGDGPSAGIQASVTWDNSVTATVPALVVEAGEKGNQGTFTRYRYCTAGNSAQNCTSTIQMVGQSGFCRAYIVGPPQQGQTPNGRLSNVAQTVNWQVDPATYTGSTFDVTVSFTADLATSTANLWSGVFTTPEPPSGPTGYCNIFGCSCGIDPQSAPVAPKLSHTFKVPPPSKRCSP
jgi:hypothetical protein